MAKSHVRGANAASSNVEEASGVASRVVAMLISGRVAVWYRAYGPRI